MQQTTEKLTKRSRVEDENTLVGERTVTQKRKSIALSSSEIELEGTCIPIITAFNALRVRFSLWTS
jgi:hypothetical protein